jgi:ectoine hydroxylase-related dioxygenase (phytanoyl-CoA dioxygenase family)
VRCRHVQCVLNFLPNREEDGGTLIVPKFHTYLPEFCEKYAVLRKNLPWVQFPKEVEEQLLLRAHRVTMEEVKSGVVYFLCIERL